MMTVQQKRTISLFCIKLFDFILLCVLLVGFSTWAARANAADAETQAKNDAAQEAALGASGGGYQDGTYSGTATGYGGPITVQVTVTDGTISDVQIVSAPNEDVSYLNQARSITSTMVARKTTNVDTVSGATYSSVGIINAAKQALSSAQGGA